MNKIYKLVWSKVRNTWVVTSEIAKGHGKDSSSRRSGKALKIAVMAAFLGGWFACTGAWDASAALPIGTNSIAEGTDAIATGKNSVAIGTGAVATGDNLTGDEIKRILKENEENLRRIEEMKKQVQATELDFNRKYEIYTRVEAAKKQIEANNKLLAETLRPQLDAANQDYNAFKPGYDKAVNEMEQRLSLISNLDFTLIAKDPANGLDTLAQELKTKSEEGYDFSNDISFYRDYINNYIKAKGDLANNKEILAASGLYSSSIYSNTAANPSKYALDVNFLTTKVGSTNIGGGSIDCSSNSLSVRSFVRSYKFAGKDVYMDDRTATLSKEELDAWTALKTQLSENGLEVINGQKSIFVDETTKQGFKDKLQAHLDYADNMYHAKYEQKCYNDLKAAGNETEALTHLQKKIEYEDKAQAIAREWNGKSGKSVEVEDLFYKGVNAWKKANIDDIENSNTLAVNTLRNQYLATLEAQKQKLAELQSAIDQATAAVEAKERENSQLQPTPEEIEEAKKAEALKQKLEAEKQALQEALDNLKLNDLTDKGTNAIAYGTNALVTGKNAIGIGTDELVTGEDSVGIGRKNTVSGMQSVAVGTENTIAGNNSGAMGTNNSVLSDNSFAVGKNNSINKEAKNNFILGNEVIISDAVSNSVVLGDGSTLSAPAKVGEVTPYGVVSVGATGKERQIQNVAAGGKDTDAVNVAQLKALNTKVDQGAIHYFSVKSDDSAKPAGTNWNNDGATGQDAIAIGKNAVSEGQDAIAIGKNAVSDRQESTAIGSQAQAYQYYSTAIGSTAIAGSHYSTALGYGAQADLNRSTAIGSTAIAGGHYSTALGYGAQADWTYSTALGGNADAQGLHSTALGGIAKAQGHYSTVLGYKAEALADGSVALGNDAVAGREAGTVGYFASASGTTLDDVLTALDKKTDYDNWTATINASKAEYERLTNAYFNASESDKAAAKAALDTWKEQHKAFVKALEERTRLEATWKASRGAVSVGADGFDEAGNTIIESRQITNVAAGTEDTDAVNVAQLKVVNEKADKNATDITNLTKTVNANGKATIVKVDGKEESTDGNLKITKKTENGQTTYDLSLSDEITIGKDGKDGKIGINGKDGASAEITVGKGEPGVDGKDGETITRIIYTDKDGKEHKVATLDDGLKFKGDNDTVVTRKLNTQLNITGGITDKAELSNNNIGVVGTQDGGMAVKLSKKLKGLTSAEFKDGDNVTNITGGNVTITRKEGNVDLWELNKTVNNITAGTTDVSSWKLQANGKDERIIKKDSVVNFKNGENTKVTVNGNDVTVDLNDATKKQISDNTTNIKNIDGRVTKIENSIDQKIEGAKVTVEGDKDTGVKVENTAEDGKPVNYKVSLDDKVKVGKVSIDGTDDKGEITGLTNTTIDADDFATKGRAATEEQLKKAMAATQEASRTMVKAGDNITVTPATEGASEYTVSLKKDISVDSVTANEYKVGDKTYINDKGINANGNTITNVADGKISEDSKEAVNGSQIYAMNQQTINNMNQINSLREESREGDALGAAMAALKPLDFDPYQRSQVMAGVGYYRGKEAVALGLAHYKNEDLMFHGGIAYAGNSELMANVGVSYRFGSKDDRDIKHDRNLRMPQYAEGPISSVYILQDEVERLTKENKEANDRIAALEAKLEKVLEKVK